MKYLLFISFAALLSAGSFQIQIDPLKSECLGGNATACAQLEKLEKQRCAQIPADSVMLKYGCNVVAQCWGNCKISIQQLNEARLRYGKNSMQYKDAKNNLDRIMADSCSEKLLARKRTF